VSNYLPILLMIVVGVAFAGLSIVASGLLGPKRATSAKAAPYECGIVPTLEPAERFPVKFYLIAMIFIIFDIEIVFLYPWAVIFGQLKTFGLVEMAVFGIAVVVAFYYLLSEGALDWGPANRLRITNTDGSLRTLSSTIRFVSIDPDTGSWGIDPPEGASAPGEESGDSNADTDTDTDSAEEYDPLEIVSLGEEQ